MNELNRDLGSGPSHLLLGIVTELNLGSLARLAAKPILLLPGCGEGKYKVYRRVPSKENGQLVLKRPKLPDGFQARVFKGNVRGESRRVYD